MEKIKTILNEVTVLGYQRKIKNIDEKIKELIRLRNNYNLRIKKANKRVDDGTL